MSLYEDYVPEPPKPKKKKPCLWCQNSKRKTKLTFSVFDDDFGVNVRKELIKFCPFCGRRLED